MRNRLTRPKRIRIMRRMKFDEVLKELAACKGDGSWQVIANRAGIHYDTVARIARGDIPNPSVLAVEKLAAAIEQMAAEKAVADSKQAA